MEKINEETGETYIPKDVMRSLNFVLISIALWFMGYNAVTTSFTKYAQQEWDMSLGSSSLCLTIATAAAIVSYIPIGELASKIGRKKTILTGVVVLAANFLAGMVLTFEGPEEIPNQPEFRCFYLPSETTFGFTDAEGWATYLSDNGQGAEIPYIIAARAVRPGNFKTVINGEVTVVKEEDWGEWHVTELTSDYTNCTWRWSYEKANFVLLFNGEKGWLIEITGTDELETLEHIARELEIRDSGQLPYFAESEETAIEGIGMIDPGRG